MAEERNTGCFTCEHYAQPQERDMLPNEGKGVASHTRIQLDYLQLR